MKKVQVLLKSDSEPSLFVKVSRTADGRIRGLSVVRVGSSSNGTPFTSERTLRPYTPEYQTAERAASAALGV